MSDQNEPSSKNWRKRGAKLGQDLTQWTQRSRARLNEWRSMSRAEWVERIKNIDWANVQRWVLNSVSPARASFYGFGIAVLIASYFLADLTALLVGRFIPEPPPARSVRAGDTQRGRSTSMEDVAVIINRNLFSSKGLMPGEESQPTDSGGTPVQTSLPLTLVGTVILQNELKSVATIEDRSAAIVYPVRIDDEIPSKIRVLKVESSRVTFVNIATGRREYVEMTENMPSRINLGVNPPKTAGIEKSAPNQFSVPRSEVDRAFSNMNELLTQARAVPNFKNGVPYGYKLFQIVPDSIFSKLGLKDNDTILGVDGEPINDPAQALNKLGGLRTSNRIELQVERDGRTSTITYDIN